MILWIPLPLLWRVKIELRKYEFKHSFLTFVADTDDYDRKLLFGLWLCTGIFIITATIVRCVICLGDAESINTGTIWSIRETVLVHSHQPIFKNKLTFSFQ